MGKLDRVIKSVAKLSPEEQATILNVLVAESEDSVEPQEPAEQETPLEETFTHEEVKKELNLNDEDLNEVAQSPEVNESEEEGEIMEEEKKVTEETPVKESVEEVKADEVETPQEQAIENEVIAENKKLIDTIEALTAKVEALEQANETIKKNTPFGLDSKAQSSDAGEDNVSVQAIYNRNLRRY